MAASEFAALDSASLPEVKRSAASVKYRWAGLGRGCKTIKRFFPLWCGEESRKYEGKQTRASCSIHSFIQASWMDEMATNPAWLSILNTVKVLCCCLCVWVCDKPAVLSFWTMVLSLFLLICCSYSQHWGWLIDHIELHIAVSWMELFNQLLDRRTEAYLMVNVSPLA